MSQCARFESIIYSNFDSDFWFLCFIPQFHLILVSCRSDWSKSKRWFGEMHSWLFQFAAVLVFLNFNKFYIFLLLLLFRCYLGFFFLFSVCCFVLALGSKLFEPAKIWKNGKIQCFTRVCVCVCTAFTNTFRLVLKKMANFNYFEVFSRWVCACVCVWACMFDVSYSFFLMLYPCFIILIRIFSHTQRKLAQIKFTFFTAFFLFHFPTANVLLEFKFKLFTGNIPVGIMKNF